MATGIAACGSGAAPPPVPEPALSPPLREAPAGTVVQIGGRPEGLAHDPATGILAVALRDPDRLALLDGHRGRTIRNVQLPSSARHLQLGAPGGPVLVPAERAGVLVRVALPGGRPLAPEGGVTVTRVGQGPHDATAAEGRIAVANEFADSVSVVDGAREVARLPAPSQPGGVASAGGRRFGVLAVRERMLELFDARALRSLRRVDAGVGPTHLVATGTGGFFVVDTQGDALLLFQTRPPVALTRRVNLPGTPYGVAIDRGRRRLWVTLTEENRLVEIDAGPNPHRLRTFPTVRQPNTVAVDRSSGRVFVAGASDGTLQLLDPPPG